MHKTAKPKTTKPESPLEKIHVAVRGTVEEHALWQAAADAEGRPLANWARHKLNEAVKGETP